MWRVPTWNTETVPTAPCPPAPIKRTVVWLANEALANLFVGLDRCQRGEKLSAFRWVLIDVADRVVELAHLLEPMQLGFADAFNRELRFEVRFLRLLSSE